MKKTVIVLALVAMFVLTFSSAAFAFGDGYGARQNGTCLRDTLTAEQQVQFDKVIENFRSAMLKLRDKMNAAREAGNSEAFQEAKAERFTLMEDKRDSLSKILPEEFAARFENFGQGMRNSSVMKGSGGFGSQNSCGR